MGKKIFSIILLCLFTCPLVHADKGEFPFEGGMTSDSIKIDSVKLTNFQRMAGKNTFQINRTCKKATIDFKVTVPKGKTAYLKYVTFLEVSSGPKSAKSYGQSSGGGSLTSVSFKVTVDNKLVKTHNASKRIKCGNDEVELDGEKEHKVHIEAIFDGQNVNPKGSIDSLSIHIHRYSTVEMKVQARCDKLGISEGKCDVCGQKKTFYINLNREGHKMVSVAVEKSSCMSKVGKVTKCQYCPAIDITNSGELKMHKFDDAGTCTVCGLHMPKSNADGTVYEIYDAGEMRVLAELVSIGWIPGNIGIDIKNDLVFSATLPIQPLGTFDNPFQGVLNGNGHCIRGNVGSFQGIDGMGFVGVAKGTFLSHAVIANLIFDRGNALSGAACVGGIVGYATNCDIINCASFGVLEGTHNVGGIVGFADQQVSIMNCASASTIRTNGVWNQLGCGLPYGHVYNSYSTATNEKSGKLDSLATTMMRHCFSSLSSGDGLTQFNESMVTTESMFQTLNEESETTVFDHFQGEIYPLPVVNTSIVAKANSAIPTQRSAYVHRASALDDVTDETSEKNDEVTTLSGYVDEGESGNAGQTVEEIMSEDSILYAQLERVYIATRSVPENARLYEPVSGGDLMSFESYYFPADSTYIKMREYDIVSPGKVKAVIENVNDFSEEHENIDQYYIADGNRQFISRITFEDEDNIVYKEYVGGTLRKVWSIETSYDDKGNATVTNGFSHNYTTGETRLEYSYTYDNEDTHGSTDDGDYEEYMDSLTNTIHVIYNTIDPATGEVISRDHYILRADDQFPLETRSEKMVNGEPVLLDGLYYIYDEEGYIVQSVAFGPVNENDPNSEIRPYLYFDYTGEQQGSPYPTTIKMPTVERLTVQKRMDTNVYDMHGRLIRRAADVKDPFNGLPRGIYIYQGAKYLKR